MTLITATHCAQLDTADEIAPLRDLFSLPKDTIYLDGNSLGAQPKNAELLLPSAVISLLTFILSKASSIF